MAESINHQFADISRIRDSQNIETVENVFLQTMKSIDLDNSCVEEQKIIREALNRQTLVQYRQYAMEQFPKEFTKQEELICQLQEQHFKHYWENTHLEMLCHQREQLEKIYATTRGNDTSISKISNYDKIEKVEKVSIMPATLWTRKDIIEFKEDILKNNKTHCIKISSLTTATIKMPTYKDGKRLFWEFATDFYDIGFGLFFEWNINPGKLIEVSILESSDDEDIEETESSTKQIDEENPPIRKDSNKSLNKNFFKLPVDELITVYRRESHMEVYCGSHEYPGIGSYILKFDNTYSVWRSKWVYYRIYYTK